MPFPANWTFEEVDAALAAELAAWLPGRLFDAHAHLYQVASLPPAGSTVFTEGPAVVDAAVWQEQLGKLVGKERLAGACFVGNPGPGQALLDAENRFLLDQSATLPGSRGAVLVTPQCTPERVAPLLDDPQLAGFKPYHCYSPQQPSWQADLDSFVPEWIWPLAHERRLIIVLHLVKSAALADPGNARYLVEHCRRYPGAQVLLAHAGRGFHAPNTERGIAALRGLDNVWFDSSGICEPAALRAVLWEFGPRRLLWGSDFPVSQIRGRAVTVGDGFAWLEQGTVDWSKVQPPCRPALVGLESLLALRAAMAGLGLDEGDKAAVFAGNAERLFGIARDTRSPSPQPSPWGRGGEQCEPEPVTQALYRRAKERIPGGTQLLSKRPEMLAPDRWPAYSAEARGCEVWDLDGRHYYDFSTNGIGSCLLGYRDEAVTAAVLRRVSLGSMSTLNPPEEVALADRLCGIHPWAEQVRFGRAGGEMCAVAVRIARATTDRSVVAICGYHGWHDWYLAANLGESDALRGHLLPGLAPLGVPRELRGTAVTFEYGDVPAFDAILQAYGDRLAAVIMEPCRYHDPPAGFLQAIRDGVNRVGALLIFDEITIGWRLHHGGSHLRFRVSPDLAVFAKALGNGHPIAAVIGTGAAMAGAHDSFISSTNWTEGVGPAAALATLDRLAEVDVPAHVAAVGNRMKAFWREHAASHGLPVTVDDGYPCLAHFAFDHELAAELRTLYTQLMLDQGYLAGTAIYPTLAHTPEIVEEHGQAIGEVFGQIAEALAAGKVKERLRGPVAHTGFRRLVG